MPNTYYLRRHTPEDNTLEKWEEVDEFVFEVRNKCVVKDQARYTDDYVIRYTDGKTEICVKSQQPTTLLAALRLSGVNKLMIDTLMTKTNLCTRPEMIKFKHNKAGKEKVHENFADKPVLDCV